MKLFDSAISKNILPYDGETYYYGEVLSIEESNQFFESLYHNIAWKQDEIIIFGKRIITKRKVAWYGDVPFEYTYSNSTKRALPWSNDLLTLKKIIESRTNETYNSCLLNLYHNGSEGMSWHSDDEVMLVENASIASLSIGVGRRFAFKHKETKEKVHITLENGSLLEMKGTTQKCWRHALPKSTKISAPRVNLTFRKMHIK